MGAVISHPHPLMGGDMGNSIVETLAEALFAGGISTLRFNFRGVGNSTGTFDDGRGEQDPYCPAERVKSVAALFLDKAGSFSYTHDHRKAAVHWHQRKWRRVRSAGSIPVGGITVPFNDILFLS